MNRALSLVLLSSLGLLLLGCPQDEPIDDTGPDDTPDDTANDDTGEPSVEPGDDIAGAMALTFDEDGSAYYEDATDPAGDRDFYFVQPPVGDVVLAFTDSYYTHGEVVCDTVIRLYDSAGTFIADNDDMPYRYWETDSGILWQATDAAGYYVEVLEWSDWDPESTGAEGGPTYEYGVTIAHFAINEWGPNDTREEVEKSLAKTKGKGLYYGNWFDEYTILFFGQIESAGDVDLYPLDYDHAFYLQTSFWPQTWGSWSPKMRLLDQDLNVIGETTDPGVYPWMDESFIYDAGITYRIPQKARYFVEISDATGAGGDAAGFFYPGMLIGWLDTLAEYETEMNHPTGLANTVVMEESETTAGLFFGRFAGALDSADDTSDNFKVRASDVDGLTDMYLSVYLETDIQGSLLDAKLTVYADAGGGAFTELATASSSPTGKGLDSPEIWDLQLSSDATVYIAIENEDAGAVQDVSQYFFGMVSVSDVPIN
ncbi:MAG: hypothetical protein JXB39_04355 [Deltaproteobacteria bacterium]|nr:hypothetical protein [Deltaproteobacteria bacterium]